MEGCINGGHHISDERGSTGEHIDQSPAELEVLLLWLALFLFLSWMDCDLAAQRSPPLGWPSVARQYYIAQCTLH